MGFLVTSFLFLLLSFSASTCHGRSERRFPPGTDSLPWIPPVTDSSSRRFPTGTDSSRRFPPGTDSSPRMFPTGTDWSRRFPTGTDSSSRRFPPGTDSSRRFPPGTDSSSRRFSPGTDWLSRMFPHGTDWSRRFPSGTDSSSRRFPPGTDSSSRMFPPRTDWLSRMFPPGTDWSRRFPPGTDSSSRRFPPGTDSSRRFPPGTDSSRRYLPSISSLLPSTSKECSSTSTASFHDNGLNIFHRHNPCSPLSSSSSKSNRSTPSRRASLDRDQARADSIQARASRTVAIPDRIGLDLGTAEYVVTVGFGTPTKEFTVIFDTASDVSWIQCQPCTVQCYHQEQPLFDPSQSSTYSNVSCSSPDCALVGSSCDSSACLYSVEYGDGSATSGFFATETLTITPSDVLMGFEFGCGEDNGGNFHGVAGLAGLGRGKVSLASQAAHKYGNVFSYCLSPFVNATGFLSFGPPRPTPNLRFTPMREVRGLPFYFVELVGISVGGKDLGIPPTVFSTAGTIIDSGTVITRLPPAAYAALRDEFRKQMSQYKAAPGVGLFDTCYNFNGHGPGPIAPIAVPAIELAFAGGASLDVDPNGVLFALTDVEACLAFAGNADAGAVGIVGNMQQVGYNVVYDVGKGVIGFGPGGC